MGFYQNRVDSSTTTPLSGVILGNGSHVQSDPNVTADTHGNLIASSLTATNSLSVNNGAVVIDSAGDLSAVNLNASIGLSVNSGAASIDRNGNVIALTYTGDGSGLTGIVPTVDTGTTSNLTGVVYGNGSSLSGDSSLTTDGSGNVVMTSLNVANAVGINLSTASFGGDVIIGSASITNNGGNAQFGVTVCSTISSDTGLIYSGGSGDWHCDNCHVGNGGLVVSGGQTSLDNGAITTDGGGNLTLHNLIANSLYSDSGGFTTDSGGSVTCSSLNAVSSIGAVLSVAGVMTVDGSGNIQTQGTLSTDNGSISSDGSGKLNAVGVTATTYIFNGTTDVTTFSSPALGIDAGTSLPYFGSGDGSSQFPVVCTGRNTPGQAQFDDLVLNNTFSSDAGAITTNGGGNMTLNSISCNGTNQLAADGSVSFATGSFTSDTTGHISVKGIDVNASFGVDGSGNMSVSGSQVTMPNLPTSDPHNSGQLWNNGGQLMISAG